MVQAAPATGTLITNQASSTFLDASAVSRARASNLVQLAVGQVAGFTLATDTTKSAAPGTAASFPHTLTNIGNGSDSFSLAATAQPGTFAFAGMQIFVDANADGVADNNVPITTTGPLAAGATFHFVVLANVPMSATAGASDSLRLDSTSVLDPSRTTTGTSPPVLPLTDIVNVVAAPVLTLSKSVASAAAQPGDTLVYQLNLRNSGGSTALSGPAVMIDGTVANPRAAQRCFAPQHHLGGDL